MNFALRHLLRKRWRIEAPRRHDDCAGAGKKVAVVVEGDCFVCGRFRLFEASGSLRSLRRWHTAVEGGKRAAAGIRGTNVSRRKTGRGRRRSHRLGSRSRLCTGSRLCNTKSTTALRWPQANTARCTRAARSYGRQPHVSVRSAVNGEKYLAHI